MKFYLFLLMICFQTFATFNVYAATTMKLISSGTYGINDIQLENKFIRLTISPHKGGRITSFYDKIQKKDYAFMNSAVGGILHMLQSDESYPGEMRDVTFKYEKVRSNSGMVSIRVSYTLARGSAAGITISRRITLYKNIPSVYVIITAHNAGYTSKHLKLRLHNWLKTDSKNNSKCIMPKISGVREIKDKSANIFHDDLTEGWLAQVNESTKTGLGLVFDYNAAEKALFYIPEETSKGATAEWIYRDIDLKPQDIWKTELRLIPFSGIKNVSYMSQDQVFSVNIKDRDVKMQIYCTRKRKVNIRPRLGRINLKTQAIELAQGMNSLKWTVPDNVNMNSGKIGVLVFGHGINFSFESKFLNKDDIILHKRKKKPLIIKKGNFKTIAIKAKERVKGQKKKVLILSTRRFYNSAWSFAFPEYKRLSVLQKRPYRWFFSQAEYTKRWAFRARESMKYFLKKSGKFSFDIAFEDNYFNYIKDLYDYDLLVLNDFPAEAVVPYIEDIKKYIKTGRGLVILGGYCAFGGRGEDYGNYRKLANILPVSIKSTPDWINQTAYPVGTRGWGNGAERLISIPETGETLSRCGPTLNIQSNMHWLANKKTLKAVNINHPIIAGIPLSTLSPSFHRVEAKEGCEVVAEIDKNPIISSSTYGKGKILSLAISDYRRLYYWPYTGKLYRQMLEWMLDSSPEVIINNVKKIDNKICVNISNQSKQVQKKNLELEIFDETGLRTFQKKKNIQLSPGETKHEIAGGNEFVVYGKYRIIAKMDGGKAYSFFYVANNSKVKIAIELNKRKHYLRGEKIQLEVKTLPKSINGEIVIASLVDANGNRVYSQNLLPDQQKCIIDTKQLAFGKYILSATLYDSQKNIITRKTSSIFIENKVEIDFPVGIYGIIPAPRTYINTYVGLAMIDRLSKDYNLGFSVSSNRIHSGMNYGIDYALGKGFYLIQFPIHASLAMAQAKDGFRDNRAIKKIAAATEKDIKAYAPYPAIYGVQLEDEAKTISQTSYDKEQFKDEFGLAMPTTPKTLEERLMLADYYARSGSLMWKTMADVIHKIRPKLKCMVLQTIINPASVGGWLWDNFKEMDVALIDLYPASLDRIAENFLYFNLMRCLAKKQNKPAWVMLGEYRNDLDSMKMQFWLLLGSGLEGYGWYYIGTTTNTGIFRKEWQEISPYQQIALKYGPLFAKWNKPDSKIGVFFSKSVLSYWAEGLSFKNRSSIWGHWKKYNRALENIFTVLYNHDLYADIFTEDDIRDQAVNKYKVLICPGVDSMEDDIKRLLAKRGKEIDVYIDKTTSVVIPNTKQFQISEIRKKIIPNVTTLKKNVYSELLVAGGMNYIVLYNHSRVKNKTELKIENINVKKIYNIITHKEVPFIKNGNNASVAQIELERSDGTILALLKNDIPKANITASFKSISNTVVNVSISLEADIKGITPFELMVFDPSGKKSRYSRNGILIDGKKTIIISFAENDIRGDWEFMMKDLITGQKKSTIVKLKK